MTLVYHPQAAAELIEASGFYEGRVSGLGSRFLDAVEDSLARLRGNPHLAPADERGREDAITPYPWLDDTAIGPWFYVAAEKLKTPEYIVGILSDIVAKNGCMLLDVGPKVDGTFPEESEKILLAGKLLLARGHLTSKRNELFARFLVGKTVVSNGFFKQICPNS